MHEDAPQNKRAKEDEDAATVNRWMALSSERTAASSGKKVKSEIQATPMEEDTVSSID